jgi:cyclohexanecarboxylate-CoA ligase
LGVGDGTPVTWQLPTRLESLVLWAALARLRATQNPIIPMYREREVGFALRQTAAHVFVVPGVWRGFDFVAMGEQLGKEMDRPPLVVVADETLPEGDPATLPPHRVDDSDPIRWVYYTSGTTSDPKGVLHTDRTLLAGGKAMAVAYDLTPSDIGSIAFPFAHVGGADYIVAMLAVGFAAVTVEVFDPTAAIELFRRRGVTMAGGSTAFYQAFVVEQRKQPGRTMIPTLRLLSGGGAPKPPEVYYEVRREIGVPVVHGYAMTEIPMCAMGSPDDTDEQLADTAGPPVTGAEIRAVLPDGSVAAPDVDGELRVRGTMVCKGYTDPALTAEAFDDGGWFRTGDLGHVRSDGRIVVTGRIKDIIIRKGENVSAKELEDLLYEHPKVADVAVIGLPDRERGERVCAVVEQAPGEAPLEFDEMVEYLRAAGLMVQKIPEQLEIVDELPRNQTLHKVLKSQLRDAYATEPWR